MWDNKAAMATLVIVPKRDNLIYEFNRKYAPVEANVKCEVCFKEMHLPVTFQGLFLILYIARDSFKFFEILMDYYTTLRSSKNF